MFDILFHINLYISLNEVEHPLQASNKKANIAYLFISLIQVEHTYSKS